MASKVLKNKKYIKHEKKNIIWSINNGKLNLQTTINLNKYQESKTKLPPTQLGICNDWRFNILDNITCTFIASWDLRRVKHKIKFIDKINTDISYYSLKR